MHEGGNPGCQHPEGEAAGRADHQRGTQPGLLDPLQARASSPNARST